MRALARAAIDQRRGAIAAFPAMIEMRGRGEDLVGVAPALDVTRDLRVAQMIGHGCAPIHRVKKSRLRRAISIRSFGSRATCGVRGSVTIVTAVPSSPRIR